MGTPHGRALAGQAVVVESGGGDGGSRLYAPVTNRGEAIGVIELRLAEAPDEQTLADVALAAHALAYIVIANRRYTDLFDWGQRSVRLSLAAEIQHRLLPGSYTCEAGQFTLAAWLEPAGRGRRGHVRLRDGPRRAASLDDRRHGPHGQRRGPRHRDRRGNPQRRGPGWSSASRRASPMPGFTTTPAGRVRDRADRPYRPRDETATIVNAGHPSPMRLRGGRVDPVALQADPPFGIVQGQSTRCSRCRSSRAIG